MESWSFKLDVDPEAVDPEASRDPNSLYVTVKADLEVKLLVLGSPETPPRVLQYKVTPSLVPRQEFLDNVDHSFTTLISFFKIGLFPDNAADLAQKSREALAKDPNRRVVPFEVVIRGEMLLSSSDAVQQYLLAFQEHTFSKAVSIVLDYIAPAETAETECSICLQKLGKTGWNGWKIVRTPCSHVYHKYCIVRWLRRKYNCPLCRYKVLEC